MEETFFKRVNYPENKPTTSGKYIAIFKGGYRSDVYYNASTVPFGPCWMNGNVDISHEIDYWLEPSLFLSRDKMIEDITEIIHEKTGLNKDNVNVELCESIADAILNSGLPEKKVEIERGDLVLRGFKELYRCPNCLSEHEFIKYNHYFCPNCGSKITWIS